MTASVRRKVTILDAMILVAAIACGFALRRITDPALGDFGAWDANWLGRVSGQSLAEAVPFLMALTVAVLAMRVRRPRPQWRRIFRQPGTAACVAAIVPLASAWLQFAFAAWRNPGFLDPLSGSVDLRLTQGTFLAGLWVLASWLALAISGRRRPERSRLDKFGRLVGLGWIVVWALVTLGSMS